MCSPCLDMNCYFLLILDLLFDMACRSHGVQVLRKQRQKQEATTKSCLSCEELQIRMDDLVYGA